MAIVNANSRLRLPQKKLFNIQRAKENCLKYVCDTKSDVGKQSIRFMRSGCPADDKVQRGVLAGRIDVIEGGIIGGQRSFAYLHW